MKILSRPHTSLQYRADIDGLRAIAVLLVVFFHAFPSFLSSGFIGVDIFFVISGYLITGSVLKEVQENQFSFVRFYGRRFKRLGPALFFILIAATLYAYWMLRQPDFKLFGAHLAAGATYTSNLLLSSETGYFDVAQEKKPLLHLWSLGVEEQFYLLWPWILILILRLKLPVLASVAVVAGLSMVGNLYGTHALQTKNFYFIGSRFWELAAGCLLCFLEKRAAWQALLQKHGDLFSWAGMAFLVLGVVFINQKTHFPGGWAVLPVLSAFLLIAAGDHSFVNQKLLSQRVLVFIGLISYPLYLWHWPLFSFAKVTRHFPEVLAQPLVMISISLLLSYLTLRFIERPVQALLPNRTLKESKSIIVTSLLVIGILFGVGKAFEHERIVSRDLARFPLAQKLEEFEKTNIVNPEVWKCLKDTSLPFTEFDSFCTEAALSEGNKKVLLIGDSEAAYLAPGLREQFKNKKIDFFVLTASSCFGTVDEKSDTNPSCHQVHQFVLKWVEKNKPDWVLLHGDWASHEVLRNLYDSLTYTVLELRKKGAKKFAFIGPTPQWIASLPEILEDQFIRESLPIPERSLVGINSKIFETNQRLKQFSEANGIRFFSVLDQLCTAEGCLVKTGPELSQLLKFDHQHLTTAGAHAVGSFVELF